MINKFLFEGSKKILHSQIKEKLKLYLVGHIAQKAQEEIRFNVSQYIKSVQNTSIEVETSKPDINKFIYKYEYLFNTLGVKLNSGEQNSILQAIKQKYLSQYPETNSSSLAYYVSRPSKNVWQIATKSSSPAPWLLSVATQDDVEELFIDFILEKIAEI